MKLFAIRLAATFLVSVSQVAHANVDTAGSHGAPEISASPKAPPAGLTTGCIAALDLNHKEVTKKSVAECAGPDAIYATSAPDEIARLRDDEKEQIVAAASICIEIKTLDGQTVTLSLPSQAPTLAQLCNKVVDIKTFEPGKR
jgi:hypothetical protein